MENTIRDSEESKRDEIENVRAYSPNQQTQHSMFNEVSNLTKAIQSVMLVANIVKQFGRFAFWVLLRQAVESRE